MNYTIEVRWSRFITRKTSLIDARGVLYMYATKDMPVYIGEAAKSTVKERLQDHRHSKRDFVVKWIKKHVPHRIPCRIKVGILYYDGVRFPYCPGMLELLHDIQTLLILSESKRDRCPANVSNTKSRKWCRPGMVVVNRNFYSPLRRVYRDQVKKIIKLRARNA